MVLSRFKRMFTRSHEGAAVSPEQAQLRLKSLKGQLTRAKSEIKRLYSEVEKAKHMSAEQKAQHRERLKELELQKTEILKEMKALRRRLPQK